MHSVERSAEPDILSQLRATHTQWDDLQGDDRRCIRNALVRDFGTICAYCERPCQSATATHDEQRERRPSTTFGRGAIGLATCGSIG